MIPEQYLYPRLTIVTDSLRLRSAFCLITPVPEIARSKHVPGTSYASCFCWASCLHPSRFESSGWRVKRRNICELLSQMYLLLHSLLVLSGSLSRHLSRRPNQALQDYSQCTASLGTGFNVVCPKQRDEPFLLHHLLHSDQFFIVVYFEPFAKLPTSTDIPSLPMVHSLQHPADCDKVNAEQSG